MSEEHADKNVANIGLIIKDCREHLRTYGEAFITADELDRIENILAELEQKDKRIQELEYVLQKVKDKIEECNKEIEKYNEYRMKGIETDVEYYENITNTEIKRILEELLEDK